MLASLSRAPSPQNVIRSPCAIQLFKDISLYAKRILGKEVRISQAENMNQQCMEFLTKVAVSFPLFLLQPCLEFRQTLRDSYIHFAHSLSRKGFPEPSFLVIESLCISIWKKNPLRVLLVETGRLSNISVNHYKQCCSSCFCKGLKMSKECYFSSSEIKGSPKILVTKKIFFALLTSTLRNR